MALTVTGLNQMTGLRCTACSFTETRKRTTVQGESVFHNNTVRKRIGYQRVVDVCLLGNDVVADRATIEAMLATVVKLVG